MLIYKSIFGIEDSSQSAKQEAAIEKSVLNSLVDLFEDLSKKNAKFYNNPNNKLKTKTHIAKVPYKKLIAHPDYQSWRSQYISNNSSLSEEAVNHLVYKILSDAQAKFQSSQASENNNNATTTTQ